MSATNPTGLHTTRELLGSGWTERALTTAVSTGELVRLRRGWYATADCDDRVAACVRVGGAAGCVTGAALHGLWVLPTDRLHVAVPRNLAHHRVRSTSTGWRGRLDLHWSGDRASRGLLPVAECLAQVARCQHPESTIAAADSALRAHLLTRPQWIAIANGLPEHSRWLAEAVDHRSESILESILRTRLAGLGLTFDLQVVIDGVGRVDFLVGGTLVIEVDGWAHHRDRDAFEEDRRRDAALTALGYRVLRFTYRQLLNDWLRVRRAILSAL